MMLFLLPKILSPCCSISAGPILCTESFRLNTNEILAFVTGIGRKCIELLFIYVDSRTNAECTGPLSWREISPLNVTQVYNFLMIFFIK